MLKKDDHIQGVESELVQRPREGRTFSRVAVVGAIVALRCNTKADCDRNLVG